MQFAGHVRLHALPPVVVHRVPLVDREDDRASSLDDETGHVGILVRDVLTRVHHQHDDVGFLYRLERLHDGKLLDRLEHLSLAPQSGRVHEGVVPAIALEGHLDRVAGGAGHVEGDHPLLAQQGIDQRALAHVGPPDDRYPWPPPLVGLLGFLGIGRQHDVQHLPDAVAVGRGDHQRVATTQFEEIGGDQGPFHAFGLVHDEVQRPSRPPEAVGDRPVLGRRAGATVRHEDEDVRLGDGVLGLSRHLMDDSRLRGGLEAAGIDDQEGLAPESAVAVMTVPREPGLVGHQRVPGTGQAIEQRALADVRPADDDQGGFHAVTMPGVPLPDRGLALNAVRRRPGRRSSSGRGSRCRSAVAPR